MSYHVGWIPQTWSNNKKFKIKATFATIPEANKCKKELYKTAAKYKLDVGPYLIWSTKQVKEQWADCAAKSKARGIAKRKATMEKKSPEERKKTYILCPQCKGTSKKLYSHWLNDWITNSEM